MRDIRADLVERIEQASKAAAMAQNLYSLELENLETKHRMAMERYDVEIDRLNMLLSIERERHERTTKEAPAPQHRAFQRKPAPETKADELISSDPIRSEADAKRRLERLTNLVRTYYQKEEIASNIHRLPTDPVGRSQANAR